MLWLPDWNLLPVIQPSVFSYSCVDGPFSNMVGNNGTMMAIRIVHSKLRKREEHSASVHPAEVLQAPPALPSEPLAFRQQPLWQFPPPLPPPYVYPHDQVSTKLNNQLLLPPINDTQYQRSISRNETSSSRYTWPQCYFNSVSVAFAIRASKSNRLGNVKTIWKVVVLHYDTKEIVTGPTHTSPRERELLALAAAILSAKI